MLITKIICPFGCPIDKATFLESTKTIFSKNSNLLLESKNISNSIIEKTKVYTCQCCGNIFETHQQNNGKSVL